MIHVAGQPTYFWKTKEIARVVLEHFVGVSSSDRGALDQGDFWNGSNGLGYLLKKKNKTDIYEQIGPFLVVQLDRNFLPLIIHSKSEDSGINYPAEKFELSANLSKNATKWPKNGQK